MRYTKDTETLNLPDFFKFGIEIEADNVKTKGEDGLYGGESAKYINNINWHTASKKEESLVAHGGCELVSPILTDTKETWGNLKGICDQIKKFPGNKGDKVVANEKCGLHVHFDSNCLTKDPKRMENFLHLYAESEELLYKMANEKNNPIRKHAINKNLKGINLISSIWRKGMAAPSGKKILKQIENGTLKVSYKKFGKLRMLASKYKLDERRYSGLNLTNIGNSKKNTIEFRMANGTLNPESIKQNVFLYASLMNTAIQMTEHPEQYEEKLENFYKTDVTEKEKANNFLNLIMDHPQNKEIFMERWESTKDATVYRNNDVKGFAQNRFKREDLKKIADRTPIDYVRDAYANIQRAIIQTKDKNQDKGAYGNAR